MPLPSGSRPDDVHLSKTAQNSHFPSQPAHQIVMASNKEPVFRHFNELGLSVNELLELVRASCSCIDGLEKPVSAVCLQCVK